MKFDFEQRTRLIRDIERGLNALPCDGIPVGILLSDTLCTQILHASKPPSRLGAAKDTARLFRWMLRALFLPRANTAPLAAFRGRIIFTLLANASRFKDLILPVAAQFPDSRKVIAGCSPKTDGVLSPLPYFPAHHYLRGGAPEVIVRFLKHWPAWSRAIRQSCDRHGFGHEFIALLRLTLFTQLLRTGQAGRIIRAVQPAGLVTEFDRNGMAACLVIAARKAGVPTTTMIHGIIHPDFGYAPLLADVALCWGEQHREKMLAGGVRPEQLVVAGNPRLQEAQTSRQEARRRMGLPDGKPLILFASQPIADAKRHVIMDAFCRAAAGLHDMADFRVRLHPCESVKFYQEEQQKYPFVVIGSNHEAGVEDSIAAADCVVTWGSGFGYDSLVCGTPVVLFNFFNEENKHMDDLIQKGKCPVATTPAQLARHIRELLVNAETRGALLENTAGFSRYFVHARGETAAKNSAAQIQAQIAARENGMAK